MLSVQHSAANITNIEFQTNIVSHYHQHMRLWIS